jgi:hypothetical protein
LYAGLGGKRQKEVHMLNADFNVQEDIIGLTDLRKHLAQIVEDIEVTGTKSDHPQG